MLCVALTCLHMALINRSNIRNHSEIDINNYILLVLIYDNFTTSMKLYTLSIDVSKKYIPYTNNQKTCEAPSKKFHIRRAIIFYTLRKVSAISEAGLEFQAKNLRYEFI